MVDRVGAGWSQVALSEADLTQFRCLDFLQHRFNRFDEIRN